MKKGILQVVGLLVIWGVLMLGFGAMLPGKFLTQGNLETITRQTVLIGFATIGMTFVIMTGAIDLSVGSLVSLATVVIALLLKAGYGPLVAAGGGLAVCMIAGGLTGFLTTKLKVGSFIVTLAGMGIYRGLAKGLAHSKNVNAPMTWLSSLVTALNDKNRWMILPIGAWLVLLCALAMTWVLRSTVFGRHTVALGSNEATARMCGVNTTRQQILVFVIAGLFFGLSGVTQFARLTVGDPTAAVGLELNVIAAVVIGGASLTGGEGSIFGALLGALIMTTINAGGSQLGWDNYIQEIVTGSIILGAVAFDRWRISRASAKEA